MNHLFDDQVSPGKDGHGLPDRPARRGYGSKRSNNLATFDKLSLELGPHDI